jgi:hypothetical protein
MLGVGAHAVARDATSGMGDTQESGVSAARLRFQRAPLFVPERVAVAMKANGLHVFRLRVDLHHEQRLQHSLLAGRAPLPVPRTSERSRSAATRQSAIVELLPDEMADGLRVH